MNNIRKLCNATNLKYLAIISVIAYLFDPTTVQ